MAQVQGTNEDRFASVRALLQELLDNGSELGASVYLNVDGEEVIDIWGGYAVEDKSKTWDKDTVTNVWSSSKTATNFAALVCIDRGLLDPNEKVSKYWPEFAQNGKENVLVKHFLYHASGVSGWEKKMTFQDICDVPRATELLAEQAPWWEPGTATGYHSINMGHLVGALVQRVTGKSLGTFIVEELATPLNADFQLGLKDADAHRAADLIFPPPLGDMLPEAWKDPNHLAHKTFLNPIMGNDVYKTPEWRGADIGAANGHTNARGIGRLLSPVARGGQSFLSQATLDQVFTTQIQNVDQVMGAPIRFGLGFGLSGPDTVFDWLPEGKVAGWGGWGGSVVLMDADRKITFSYVMNKMEHGTVGNSRCWKIYREVYKCLGVELKEKVPIAMG